MLEIAIGVAVVLVVLAVPRLRSAFLSFMGLAAIIAAGSAVVVAVVWALYEAKPWLTPDKPLVAEDASAPAREVPGPSDSAEEELRSALATEEAQRLAERRQNLELEKLRIAALVGRARYILEEDRKFAAHAALNPLPAGVSSSFSNIIAIRIPAWRDSELAEREAETIRAWLRSIGLTADETATITTAKAWGSLYDMWLAERQAGSSKPEQAQPAASSDQTAEVTLTTPEAEQEPGQGTESEAEPAPSAPAQDVEEQPPVDRQALPSRTQARSVPPGRVNPPRPAPPRRGPAPRRDVGPFGY